MIYIKWISKESWDFSSWIDIRHCTASATIVSLSLSLSLLNSQSYTEFGKYYNTLKSILYKTRRSGFNIPIEFILRQRLSYCVKIQKARNTTDCRRNNNSHTSCVKSSRLDRPRPISVVLKTFRNPEKCGVNYACAGSIIVRHVNFWRAPSLPVTQSRFIYFT